MIRATLIAVMTSGIAFSASLEATAFFGVTLPRTITFSVSLTNTSIGLASCKCAR